MVILGKLKVGDIVQKISVSRGRSRRHPEHTETDSKYEEARGGYMGAIGIVTQIETGYSCYVKFDPLDDGPAEMFAYQLRKVGHIQ